MVIVKKTTPVKRTNPKDVKIKALESERLALLDKVDSLEKEKISLKKVAPDIDSLKKELSSLTGERTAFKNQVTALEAEKVKLGSEMEKLNTSITSSQGKISRLETEKNELSARLASLGKGSGVDVEPMIREISSLKLERTGLKTQVGDLNTKYENLLNDKQKLAEQIENLKKTAPSLKIEDMSGMFKKTLASLQRDIKEPEKPGETGYIIDKFEVEMKTGLDMSDGMKLIQPTAGELKPEGLSTVRMSFKARPKLKIARED